MHTIKRLTLIIVALISASAGAARTKPTTAKGPRLGSFSGMGRGAVGSRATNVHFVYRKARGKLYWETSSPEKQGKAPAGVVVGTQPSLRQSFDVISDRVTASGVRVLEYVRPNNGSRSAKYNQRKLSTFFGGPVISQKGNGTIAITPKGNAVWINSGTLEAGRKGNAVELGWKETFAGARTKRGK